MYNTHAMRSTVFASTKFIRNHSLVSILAAVGGALVFEFLTRLVLGWDGYGRIRVAFLLAATGFAIRLHRSYLAQKELLEIATRIDAMSTGAIASTSFSRFFDILTLVRNPLHSGWWPLVDVPLALEVFLRLQEAGVAAPTCLASALRQYEDRRRSSIVDKARAGVSESVELAQKRASRAYNLVFVSAALFTVVMLSALVVLTLGLPTGLVDKLEFGRFFTQSSAEDRLRLAGGVAGIAISFLVLCGLFVRIFERHTSRVLALKEQLRFSMGVHQSLLLDAHPALVNYGSSDVDEVKKVLRSQATYQLAAPSTVSVAIAEPLGTKLPNVRGE